MLLGHDNQFSQRELHDEVTSVLTLKSVDNNLFYLLKVSCLQTHARINETTDLNEPFRSSQSPSEAQRSADDALCCCGVLGTRVSPGVVSIKASIHPS